MKKKMNKKERKINSRINTLLFVFFQFIIVYSDHVVVWFGMMPVKILIAVVGLILMLLYPFFKDHPYRSSYISCVILFFITILFLTYLSFEEEVNQLPYSLEVRVGVMTLFLLYLAILLIKNNRKYSSPDFYRIKGEHQLIIKLFLMTIGIFLIFVTFYLEIERIAFLSIFSLSLFLLFSGVIVQLGAILQHHNNEKISLVVGDEISDFEITPEDKSIELRRYLIILTNKDGEKSSITNVSINQKSASKIIQWIDEHLKDNELEFIINVNN